jgi:cation diffusion facilitator CzcD-associated flavoprotein CzcO
MISILIVGSGFAGLGAGIKLKEAGFTGFTILERAGEIGGTWRDNRYPGCACDVPAHLYSFSFEPNPGWTRVYAGQPEIQDYLLRCVDKYGLRPHIRCNQDVTEARYDEGRAEWVVRTAAGEEHRARVLISARGGLSNPALPDIPGLERFQGPRFHSAAWDHGTDLAGRRVAVIGTGASAIQIVPEIAPRVERLDLYQRSAPWVVPRPDRPIGRLARWLFRVLPFTQRLVRASIYWKLETRVLGFAVDPRLMKVAEREARRHIRRQVGDAELRRLVTPDYQIGCKRVLLSDDYYPALGRPNVQLIAGAPREVRAHGIVGPDGQERAVDAIILGTGFKTQEPVARGAVFGRGGVDLCDAWQSGPEAYKGSTVSGFPNLFFLLGPNTGLGHSSMVYVIESQVAYVVDAVRQMARNRWAAVDVDAGAQAAWNRDLQARHGGAVWKTGCTSWYLNRNGKNTALWPGFTFRFRRATARFDPRNYRVEAEAASAAGAGVGLAGGRDHQRDDGTGAVLGQR